MFVHHFVDLFQGVEIFFFCDEKVQLLKAPLTGTFIPSLFSSFDLLNYSSESRKKYKIRLLLMFLGAEGVLEVVLVGV